MGILLKDDKTGFVFGSEKKSTMGIIISTCKNIFDYVNETQNTQFFKKKFLFTKDYKSRLGFLTI